MALDEGGTSTRKKKRRRPPPRPPARGADSAEAARFTRSRAYKKIRRRRYRSSDSGEASGFTRSPEYAQTRRLPRSERERDLELIELYKALGEPDAPRFLEALARSDNPLVRRSVETLGPSTEDVFELLESRPARFTHNLARDVEQAAVGFPESARQAGSAVGFDVRDIVTGRDRTPGRTAKLGKEIAEGYRHTYGPLVQGDFEEFGERVFEHPLGPILDTGAVASLGTSAGIRAGLVRAPARERKVRFEEGTVQPHASPNALTRAAQHALDRLSERAPMAPVVGARNRVARRVPFEREREHERAKAPAIPFQRSRRRLSVSEDFAYDRLARYGWATREERARTLQLVDEEIALRQRRLRGETDGELAGKVTLAEKAGQRKQLAQLRLGRKHVANPSPKLLAALEEGSRLQARSQQTKVEAGQLTETSARERVDLPARIVSGARAERTPSRQGRVEHVREYHRGERTLERPRTLEEAQARLAGLDAEYEAIVAGIERVLTGGQPADLADVAGRNLYNAKTKGRRRGRQQMRTVKQDVRRLAEAELDKVIRQRPDSPEVQELLALLEERNALNALVNDPERAFGGEVPDLGTVSETMPAEIVRRHFAAQDPQRAETRIVGAEDVEAGPSAFFLPDVARAPIRSLGARARSVLGRPRRLTYKNEGVLFLQGRTRTGSKLTLEDFAKTTRYQAQLLDIDEVATFSKPLNPESPSGLDGPHMRHFNPEGVSLPRSFRDEPTEAELEGLTPRELAEAVRADHEALVRNTFPTEAELLGLPPELAAQVRQVDSRIVDAFTRGGARYNGFGHGIGRVLAEVFDVTNNLTRAGFLYLKGSFVPMNFLADTGLLTIQQGVWAPANLMKAAHMMGDFQTPTLRRLDVEVGGGPALAVSGEGRGFLGAPVQKLAEASNVAASLLTRRAAIIHELGKRGFKNDEQVNRLLDAADAGRTISTRDGRSDAKSVLNQISETAENAMVRYRGGSQFERDVVTRAVFVYPWVRGSTRYAARLPFDRPLRADFIAHLGAEGYDELREKLGQLASYFDTLIPIGQPAEKLGTTVVPVVRPDPVTPFGTAVDVLQAGRGAVVGGAPQRSRLANFASPALKAGIEAVTGYNTFAGYPYPPGTSALEILAEASGVKQFPLVTLAQGLDEEPQTAPFTGPPGEQPNFVEGGAREAVGRFLAGGLFPRELNLPAAQARGFEEALELMEPSQRARVRRERDVTEKVAEARRVYRQAGLDMPDDYPDLVRRRALYQAAQDAIREDTGADRLTPAQRTLALIAVADQAPELADLHDEYMAAWSEARGDPLDEGERPNGPMTRLGSFLQQLLFGRLYDYDSALEQLRDRARLDRG